MKKFFRNIITSMTACTAGLGVVMATSSVNANASAAETPKTTFNYVDFGASQTVGYGLKGFVPIELLDDPTVLVGGEGARDGYYSSGYYYYPEKNYPSLVKNGLQERLGESYNVVLHQHALNSMRAYDLDYILNDDKPADEYIAWRLGDENNGWIHDLERERHDVLTIKGVDYHYDKEKTSIRDEYRQAVIDADLISYDLGVNDFGVYLANMIFASEYGNNMYNVIPEQAEDYYTVKAYLEAKLMEEYGDSISTATLQKIDYYADTLAYAFLGFTTSFDRAMTKIYDLNPDVEIIVVGIQNIMKGFGFKLDGKIIDIGSVMNGLITLANAYTSYLSPFADRYYYTEVEDQRVEYFLDELCSWDGTLDSLMKLNNIIDCFKAYQKGMQIETIVKAKLPEILYGAVGPLATNLEAIQGALHITELPTYDQTIYVLNYLGKTTEAGQVEQIKDTMCEAMYFTLARVFKYVCEDQVMEIPDASLDLETALGEIGNLGAQVAAAALAGTDIDSMADMIDEQAKLIIPSNMKGGAFIGIYSSFANSFFTHPTEKGHQEQAEVVLRAYDAKENKKAVDTVKLIDFVKNLTKEDVFGYLDFAGEQLSLISEENRPEIEGAIGEAKVIINKAEEIVNEIKAVVAESKEEIAFVKEILKELGVSFDGFGVDCDDIKAAIGQAELDVVNIIYQIEAGIAKVEEGIEYAKEVTSKVYTSLAQAKDEIESAVILMGRTTKEVYNIAALLASEIESLNDSIFIVVRDIDLFANDVAKSLGHIDCGTITDIIGFVGRAHRIANSLTNVVSLVKGKFALAIKLANRVDALTTVRRNIVANKMTNAVKDLVEAFDLLAEATSPATDFLAEKIGELDFVNPVIELVKSRTDSDIEQGIGVIVGEVNNIMNSAEVKTLQLSNEVLAKVDAIKAHAIATVTEQIGAIRDSILAAALAKDAPNGCVAMLIMLQVKESLDAIGGEALFASNAAVEEVNAVIAEARAFIEATANTVVENVTNAVNEVIPVQQQEVIVNVITNFFGGWHF